MSEKSNRLSVLIVTWDGDALLTRCLDSIVAARGELPEIVVVDNADLASTRELVARYAGAKYVPSPTNLGFAGGNNLGLSRCTGEYIVLLNNDTEVEADSFTQLVCFADAHPAAGAVQGGIVRDDGRLDYCGMDMSPIGQMAARGLCEERTDLRFAQPYRVCAASGAFMLVRRSAIRAMGDRLFRDEFKSYYEDVDLCIRLWMCGYEVWYCPTAPVLHHGGMTARRLALSGVAEQGFCNRWYSILMSWGILGRLYLLPQLFVLLFGHAFVSLLRGDATMLAMQTRVLGKVFSRRKAIRSERKRFLPLRKRSDLSVFRQIIVHQPWSYYRRLLATT